MMKNIHEPTNHMTQHFYVIYISNLLSNFLPKQKREAHLHWTCSTIMIDANLIEKKKEKKKDNEFHPWNEMSNINEMNWWIVNK